MDHRTYFAALPSDEIAPELMKRVNDWNTHITTSGQFARMKSSYNAYYGTGFTGNTSEITKSGVQGELSLIKVNHFRNLIQHMLVMCTSNRPAMQARALNTDYKSQAQVILANGILDYYLKEKNLETHFKDAAEISLVFGEGFVTIEWDSQLGNEFDRDPDTGESTFSGDLRYRTLTPIDVIKDLYLENAQDQEWLIIRYWKNKFSLAAKYPDLANDILDLAVKSDEGTPINFFNRTSSQTELIPVYVLYAEKSDALPEGRQVAFLDDDIVLFDGPLPYQEIPVYRISPGNYIGSPFGYTAAFDLLALQQAYDAMFSTVLTNQATFGVQSIMTPIGRPLSVSQLDGGMNLIQYDPASGPPTALQLTKTAPEIFEFIKIIEQTMESISGINSVSRGNPEASLRSGSALALIQSMAIQFNTGLQQSYAQLIEAVGTATINTLKDFAAAPRIALITGLANTSMVKEFVGGDLDQINRVIVDVGNPLAHTTAGKLEIATNLVQQGLITTPQEYLTVLNTGNLDPLMQNEQSQLELIHRENENMSSGKSVRAIIVDKHVTHIEEHTAVLNSPEIRENQEITTIVLDHINEHINLLRTADPGLLQILKQPSLPPMAPPMPQGSPGMPMNGPTGPGQAPGQPPIGPQSPPPGAPPQTPNNNPTPGPSGVLNGLSPAANNVAHLPQLPRNPLGPKGPAGRFNNVTGGLPQK